MKKQIFILSAFLCIGGYAQEVSNIREGRKQLEKNIQKFEQEYVSKVRLNQSEGQVPPNLYFEQDYKFTMNPFTGEINRRGLQKIWKEVEKGRFSPKEELSVLLPVAKGNTYSSSQENYWIERGPYKVGGRTRAIMFDPNDATGKRVFAGGVSGGLWVNDDITDVSSEWTPLSNFWENTSVVSMAYDPNNTQVFYVGTGESCTGSNIGSGIWRTQDGGQTWENIFTTPITYSYGVQNGIFYVNDIEVRNNNGTSEVYAGVSGGYNEGFNGLYNAGLYKSTDGGDTFTLIESLKTPQNIGYSIQEIEISADNSVWVSTRKGFFSDVDSGGRVFKSTDAEGKNFINVYNGNLSASRVNFTLSKTDPNKAYVLMQGNAPAEPVRILKTTDGGQTWLSTQNANSGITLPVDRDPQIPANDFTRGQSFYDLVIQVDPENDDIVYAGGINVQRSEDGAKTWRTLTKWNSGAAGNNVVIHADQHAVVFNPFDAKQILFGNDGGVFYSADKNKIKNGSGINVRNARYNVTQFYDAALNPVATPENEDILAGAQDNGTQALFGAPSANQFYGGYEYTGGDGGMVAFDDENKYVINSYIRNEYYLYSNLTNQFVYLVDKANRSNGHFINEMALDKNLDVFYSYNKGLELVRVKGLASKPLNLEESEVEVGVAGQYESVSKIAVSPYTTTSSTVFVGTSSGRLFKVTNANTDNSTSVEITTPFVGSVSDIEFGANENEILVTIPNYGPQVNKVYYTTDGGQTWENKFGNLPDMPIRCAFINPENSNEVLLGTELGVWGTTDFLSANPTWSQYSNGIGNVRITNLDYRPATQTLLASTYGRGVFTSATTDILSTENIQSKLSQIERVYPNPSRGNLNLHYDDSKYSDVNIKIYDLLGKLVYSKDSLKNDEEFYVKLSKGVYVLEAKSKGETFFTSNVMIK